MNLNARQDRFSYNTIKTYLLGPQHLQIQTLGHWQPLSERPIVKAHLTAAKRILGDFSKKKEPMTPELMYHIFLKLGGSHLILNDTSKLVVWTSFVIAFWSFLRKSNLLASTANFKSAFSDAHVLRRRDAQYVFCTDGLRILSLVLSVTLEKNEQFGSAGPRQIPLPALPAGHPASFMCPVLWSREMLRRIPLDSAAPLFSFPARGTQNKSFGHPFTHTYFESQLKQILLSLGIDDLPVNDYSGHSFRRGAASFAFNKGIPPELIKLQGHWKSEAYQIYSIASLETKAITGKKMMDALFAEFAYLQKNPASATATASGPSLLSSMLARNSSMLMRN